ncbi:glycosyl hydrolase family 28-related protein [Paracraurococcus ruber]|uniref:Hydrolase n=1 Tax=Paracraurococcus ruber TaxID=77675 RepID=A0ABS1CVI8_9PROT|nr:glycosyl hydrolase family 28-related protein [Paracraurococcus ruber]MBK1658057.1 hydrolase [Paracraurococcus ruber]TDG34202.1 hydrolase [Paracraurococcus ruber]
MDEHIRIGDIAPRVQYLADGTQASFTYPFPIFEAGDLEVRLDGLVQVGGYTVAGAGQSEGGSVAFDAAPATGTRVTLRRSLAIARTTDFQANGVLRARTLNDELDYQIAALQEVKDEVGSALRFDPSEVGGAPSLPLPAVRANKLLGFDSLGGVAVFDRGEGTTSVPFPGGIPRTVEDKLAERLSARDFGAVGDGTADDGPALQAAMNAAAASGKFLEIGEGTFRTTQPLLLPGAAAGLLMRGTILYAGPGGAAALTLGDGGSANNQRKVYAGLSVFRALQSDWLDEADVGIRIRNIDASRVEVRRAERFTIGVQVVGDERGSEDSDLHYGRLIDNRIALDLRTLTSTAWMNSLRHHGGHFACSSATNPGIGRFGVRLSAAPGAYRLHNAHLFLGPGFELQRQGTPGTVDAIPFLLEVDGRGLTARGVRMEACSPFVARHTAAFNDAVYEVAFVGTYGFTGCAVDYAGATRAGGTVLPLHQAAAALGTPRLVAEASNIRARAFRWDAASTGFEGLAVLSGNPTVPANTLTNLCFPGLNLLTLNADTVTLPTSRALAFVVDCTICKEFFLAAEGSALRPMVLQFDAAENALDSTAPALLSNMNIAWQGAPSFWWEGVADLDSLVGGLALNRLQRVTLAPNAAFAAIGVRGGNAASVLKSLRLYVPGTEAPMVLAGAGRAWGTREFSASLAYDPPSLVAGANASQIVSLPNVQNGDFVQASFAGQVSGFMEWTASVTNSGAAGTVTARVTNRHPSTTIDLSAGTVLVRALKPRV